MKKLIGSKAFYKGVLAIAVPIILQNGIANLAGMLDNIMVGIIGTEQMSGVSIVNQLIFVFQLCIFGAVSGAGIFGAQFYGQNNREGLRDTFRYKLVIAAVLLCLAEAVFLGQGARLISLYLHEGEGGGNLAATLAYGERYLKIMLIGMVPFTLEQCYSSTLRETGETIVPMKASMIAVLIDTFLNYVLIYGKLGFPELGVDGAAYSTVLARFIQAGIVIVWTHKNLQRNTFMTDVYRSLRIPFGLMKKILITGLPLLLNETLWASGVAAQTQCYSVRGLSVVASLNINSTIYNVFTIVFIALGDSVAIIVGQLLGAGKLKEARETAYKIIFFSVGCCLIVGAALFGTAHLFPRIYNTTDEIRSMATGMIRISAVMMPLQAFLHATYFTIRSGGKTVITFLFDSVFLWIVAVPAAYLLAYHTGFPILTVFLFCQLLDCIKATVGWLIMVSGVWVQNIVGGLQLDS
ncbi:MAG: MATE family efflux transporter [Lachnospiraceae bacterium]